MFKTRLRWLFALVLTIRVGSVDAAVLSVGASRSFESITEAVLAAENGDCIMVGPGNYAEEIRLGGTPTEPKTISLVSEQGPGETYIDKPLSGGSGIGVFVEYGLNVTICGFTIRNHNAYGIQSRNSTGTTIHNCVIFDNASSGIDMPGAYSPNSAAVHDNTIVANAYGILQDGAATTTCENNIVVSNRSIDVGCYSLGTLGCNLFGTTNCSITPTDGQLSCTDPVQLVGCNISPLFQDFAARNLELDPGSSAISQFATCGGVGATFGPCNEHGCDVTPPVVQCPPPISQECTSPSGAIIDFSVTATDDIDPSPSIATDVPPGSTFPIGVTTVHGIAADASGNVSSCEFDVTVTQGTGTLAGTVASVGMGLDGVQVDVFDSHGTLVFGVPTDGAGEYSLTGVPSGEPLTVAIVTPLGYSATENAQTVTVPCGDTATVDFSLVLLPVVVDPRSIGFWMHQVGVATGGHGSAQVDAATLCEYLDLIEVHFNSYALNPVIVYQPPTSGVCNDKLEVTSEVLNLRGSHDMRTRARQQLMALLLNVASGRLSLQAEISLDHATAAQAISYTDMVIDDAGGDYELAKTIADQINNGRTLSAGIIPASTPNPTYKSFVPPEYALDQNVPNPFNPTTEIRFSLPSSAAYGLTILDVRGRRVRTFSGTSGAGTVRITWNGRDDQGLPVAAGTYLYRVRAPGYVAERKMTLLK